MQKWLEKSREKLQKDFELWIAQKRRERGLRDEDEKESLSDTINNLTNQLSTN